MIPNQPRFGRFEPVDLRAGWLNEASDFTPWLAREENLLLLADTLHLDLVLEAQEKNVGPFRADLLCRDLLTGSWVLIENQLERTDHTHLGQIITYAAGLKAVTVIWIAPQFTDEHRAALDWLNEVTDEGIHFFGVEVELWKIDDSLPAPRFNIVSQPNDWQQMVRDSARAISAGNMTGTQQLQYEYWQAFADYFKQHNSTLRLPKPAPTNLIGFPIGRSSFLLVAFFNTREKRLGVALEINETDGKTMFSRLLQEKEQIEGEIGSPMEWLERPNNNNSYIRCQIFDADIQSRARWPEYFEWQNKMIVIFDRVFRNRIKTL